MPSRPAEKAEILADRIGVALGDKLEKYADDLDIIRDLLDGKVDVAACPTPSCERLVSARPRAAESDEEQEERMRNWDPVDLLVPEWDYLQRDPASQPRGPSQRPDSLTDARLTRPFPAGSPGCWPSSGCARSTRWSASPGSTTWTGRRLAARSRR